MLSAVGSEYRLRHQSVLVACVVPVSASCPWTFSLSWVPFEALLRRCSDASRRNPAADVPKLG